MITSELTRLSPDVTWLEIRADLTGEPDVSLLRTHFPGSLLYSLREGPERGELRESRLIAASREYELVELNARFDLSPRILEAIPPSKRMVAWYGSAPNTSALREEFDQIVRVPASSYKLVVPADDVTDGLTPLKLLHELKRGDVVAYADGNSGFWTRPLAAHLGSQFTYGSLCDESNSSEPSVLQLIRDYDLPRLRSVAEIYGIVGEPILHSLSPYLHNAAYRALDIPGLFLPFHTGSFDRFWTGLIEKGTLERMGLTPKGFTVGSPHKRVSLAISGEHSNLTRTAESSNIVHATGGTWRADTTDPDGILLNLARRSIDVENRRVAVIGCGGSGRAIAASLAEQNANVTLVNRSFERGRWASQLLGLPFIPISEFSPAGYFLLVNATPVGRDGGSLSFKLSDVDPGAVIVDLVYGRQTTPLVAQARDRGDISIDGREVLLAQVTSQFQTMTGQMMPAGLAGWLCDMET